MCLRVGIKDMCPQCNSPSAESEIILARVRWRERVREREREKVNERKRERERGGFVGY